MSKQKLPVSGKAEALTFSKDLILPPQSQVTQYEDKVAERIRQLDDAAAQLGRGFGLPYTPGINVGVDLSESTDIEKVFGFVLLPRQYVSLQRQKGDWGLYYSFIPGSMTASKERPHMVPLRDAPLDVRERFLHLSEKFFRDYLATCENRLSTMNSAVSAGDRTLALLKDTRLE